MNKLLQGKDYSNYSALKFSTDLVTDLATVRVSFCVCNSGKVTSAAVEEIFICNGEKAFVIKSLQVSISQSFHSEPTQKTKKVRLGEHIWIFIFIELEENNLVHY